MCVSGQAPTGARRVFGTVSRIYSPHTRSRTGPGGHDALASPRCVKNIPLVMVSETMAVCNVALLMAMK